MGTFGPHWARRGEGFCAKAGTMGLQRGWATAGRGWLPGRGHGGEGALLPPGTRQVVSSRPRACTPSQSQGLRSPQGLCTRRGEPSTVRWSPGAMPPLGLGPCFFVGSRAGLITPPGGPGGAGGLCPFFPVGRARSGVNWVPGPAGRQDSGPRAEQGPVLGRRGGAMGAVTASSWCRSPWAALALSPSPLS